MKAWIICKTLHTIAYKNVVEKTKWTPTISPQVVQHHARSCTHFSTKSHTQFKIHYTKITKTSTLFSPFFLSQALCSLSLSKGFIRGLVAEPIWHSVHLPWMLQLLEAASMPNWLCKFPSEKPYKINQNPLMRSWLLKLDLLCQIFILSRKVVLHLFFFTLISRFI